MRRAKKKKKGIKGQRTIPLTLAQAIDALVGDEEKNGKKKKKETGRRPSNPTTLHHLVASDDPHLSCGGPILKGGGKKNIYIYI